MGLDRKYTFAGSVPIDGITYHILVALKDFADVKADDFGGLVESEANLSQSGNCWIYSGMAMGDSKVFGNAQIHGCKICDNAQVYGDTIAVGCTIKDNAKVSGGKIYHATIEDNAQVYDEVQIFGIEGLEKETRLFGDSEVYDHAIIEFGGQIGGKAKVHGQSCIKLAKIGGNTEITGNAVVARNTNGGKIIATKYVYG